MSSAFISVSILLSKQQAAGNSKNLQLLPITIIFNVWEFQVGLYTNQSKKLMNRSKMQYLTNKGFHLEFFCIDHQSLGSEANMLCSQHQPQDICKSRNREFDIIKPYIILNDAIETRQNSSQLLSSIFP